jgi:hypothetical protein
VRELNFIQIGPYERFGPDQSPPQSWGIVDSQPRCHNCNKSLHVLFNSPPRTGEATCGCEGVKVKIHRV